MIRTLRAALCALLAFALALPARAERLVIPLTGHRARPTQARTLFHTLFSDFFSEADNTTYVQTGDIPAMWLRDSAAQTLPYVRFAQAFPILAVRFSGVVERDARNITVDPYANAFNTNYVVWEEKWEVDSLAWPVLLAWVYRERTGHRNIYTPQLHRAFRTIVGTYRCEQLHATCSRYSFPGVDTRGRFNPNTGMIWTAFRPSDDRVKYHFNIPQEMIAVVALRDLARMAIDGYGDRNLANEADSIATQVYQGIVRYGMVPAPDGGWMYVYETDGLGHDLLMDDANVPDLTSMPYLGWCSAYDPAYVNTRNYVLSAKNPWYFSGAYAQGLGSPHTPAGFVWPLGIITRALTATSSAEVAESITMLAETDASDGLMHESFWPNGYWLFTRADFGWANALYAELIFRTVGGFSGTAFLPDERTIVPGEIRSATPPITAQHNQLRNAAVIYSALGELLQQANGRTIIPSIAGYLMSTSRYGGPQFHEVQDIP